MALMPYFRFLNDEGKVRLVQHSSTPDTSTSTRPTNPIAPPPNPTLHVHFPLCTHHLPTHPINLPQPLPQRSIMNQLVAKYLAEETRNGALSTSATDLMRPSPRVGGGGGGSTPLNTGKPPCPLPTTRNNVPTAPTQRHEHIGTPTTAAATTAATITAATAVPSTSSGGVGGVGGHDDG